MMGDIGIRQGSSQQRFDAFTRMFAVKAHVELGRRMGGDDVLGFVADAAEVWLRWLPDD